MATLLKVFTVLFALVSKLQLKLLVHLTFPKYCRLSSVRKFSPSSETVGSNLLKPTGHVMHQQFNIQQLYALPTLYLCVLYLSENKQRLVPLTA